MWLQLDPLNPLNHEDHPVPRSSALFFRGHHRAPYGPVGEQQPGGALSLGTCWNMLERWSCGAKGWLMGDSDLFSFGCFGCFGFLDRSD